MRVREATVFGMVALILLYWNAASKMVILTSQPVPLTLRDVLELPFRDVGGFLLALLVELVFSVSQLAFTRKREQTRLDQWAYFGLVVFSAWLSFIGVGQIYAGYFGGGSFSVWFAFLICILIDFLAEQLLKYVVQ